MHLINFVLTRVLTRSFGCLSSFFTFSIVTIGVHIQRRKKAKGRLSKLQIERLEAVGFKWSVHKALWNNNDESQRNNTEEGNDTKAAATPTEGCAITLHELQRRQYGEGAH